MICYSVNNISFSNGLAAFDYAARHCPHASVQFNFDDQFWGSQDWTNEPAPTFSILLDQRAQQLREKYGYLIFYFSGGTDSYLMWEVFRRNQIRIDEIVVVVSNTKTVFDVTGSVDVVTWLFKNHYDPHTKITAISKISGNMANDFYENKTSLEKTYSNQPLPIHSNAQWIYQQLLNNHYHQNPGIVIGVEKPLLIFQSNSWFVSHNDKTYRLHLPKIDQVEWFYVSKDLPELYIKQCHMLLKKAQEHRPIDSVYWTTAEWNSSDYSAHAMACGRIGELFTGTSKISKVTSNSWDQSLSDETTEISKLVSSLIPKLVTEFVNRALSFDTKLYMQRQRLYNGSDHDWHGIYSKLLKISNHA